MLTKLCSGLIIAACKSDHPKANFCSMHGCVKEEEIRVWEEISEDVTTDQYLDSAEISVYIKENSDEKVKDS